MKSRARARNFLPRALIVLICGLPAWGSPAAPREPVPRDLAVPGELGSVANALNDRGQVVGVSLLAFDEVRSFLWEAGEIIDLGPGNMSALEINNRGQILLQESVVNIDDPNSCFLRDGETLIDLGNLGGTQCFASDLNDRGQVVGSIAYGSPSQSSHAFLWESGTMIDLGSLGGGYARAESVNDRGQVVGVSNPPLPSQGHAFLWERGVMTDLGAPGGDSSQAVAINNHGQVLIESGMRAYLWEAGSITDLGTLGGSGILPLDLNDRKQVLALVFPDFSTPPYGPPYGVIWEAGAVTRLPSLGSGFPSARRLNNRGQAAGTDGTSNPGLPHAVLWTPNASKGRAH